MSYEVIPGIWEEVRDGPGYYSEMAGHLQNPAAGLNDDLNNEWYGANIDEFYVKAKKWVRESDVSRFNSVFGNIFGNYGAPNSTEFIDDGMYGFQVPVSGAVTDARKEAVDDIIKYMIESGMLEAGEIDSIYLDKNLPKNILGRTGFDGDLDDVDVVYNPRIFNESYENIRDPIIRDAVKYIQARTLKHERVHEEMLSHPDAYNVAKNLAKMGYSENVFKGLLEGIAEFDTMEAFYGAGDTKFGNKVRNESPYKKQLDVVEKMRAFRYDDGETVYKGPHGLYEATAKGLLSKKTTDDMLRGIELKESIIPSYKHSGACGKYNFGGACGSSCKYAS